MARIKPDRRFTEEQVAESRGTSRVDDRTVTLIDARMTADGGANQAAKLRNLLNQGVITPGPTFNRLK